MALFSEFINTKHFDLNYLIFNISFTLSGKVMNEYSSLIQSPKNVLRVTMSLLTLSSLKITNTNEYTCTKLLSCKRNPYAAIISHVLFDEFMPTCYLGLSRYFYVVS